MPMSKQAAVEPATAPELPPPPGMKYSDGLAAYQIVVAMRGNPDALQKRALPGWKVSDAWGPGPRGMALGGANLLMVFHEALFESNPKTLSGQADSQRRFVVFAMRADNPSTNEGGMTSIVGFSSDAGGLPGNYNDQRLAKSVIRKLSLTGDGSNTQVSESYDIDTGDGSIHFAIDYKRPNSNWDYTPAASSQAIRFHASRDPSVYRVYHEDLVGYLVMSRPINVNFTTKFEVSVKVPALADVFEGAQPVALMVRPSYTRRVFVKAS
jgi:hypothetical protein